MSLINDALKQASRSPKTAAAIVGQSAGGLRPVEEPRSGRKSALLPFLFVLVLAGAGWFFWQWWQTRGTGNESLNIANLVQSVKSMIPGQKPAEPGATVPAGAPDKPGAASAPDAGVAATPAGEAKPGGNFIDRVFNKPGPADPNAVPAGGFPPIKVQGIYYRTGDSTVLINGKNLTEGEQIEGVIIAKIERQTVTLEFQGQTKEIKLH